MQLSFLQNKTHALVNSLSSISSVSLHSRNPHVPSPGIELLYLSIRQWLQLSCAAFDS